MRESVVCIFLHERPGGICIEALNMQKVRHHASGKQPESVQSDIFSFFQGRPSGQQGRPGGLWVSVFLLGGAKKLHSTRPLFFCSGGGGNGSQQIAYGTDFLKHCSRSAPPFNHFCWFSCCFCSVAGIVLVFCCFLQMISLLFLRPWCVSFLPLCVFAI